VTEFWLDKSNTLYNNDLSSMLLREMPCPAFYVENSVNSIAICLIVPVGFLRIVGFSVAMMFRSPNHLMIPSRREVMHGRDAKLWIQ
jgi:hypothetical protein